MVPIIAIMALAIVHSSVPAENALKPLSGLGDTVRVVATVDSAKLESDGDLYLILEDSGFYEIAEIMAGTRAMNAFQMQFGPLSGHWKKLKIPMQITGIRYFDHERGQKGAVVRDGFQVEIHPVKDFAIIVTGEGNPKDRY